MPTRRVDALLLLDKPVGLSSNAALQRARRLYRARRAGHTGTLDPLAGGLLPLCFGEATKFAAAMLEADKSYRARIRFGARTSTGDAEGEVIARAPIDFHEGQLLAVLERFVGELQQVPPMYSALKHQGRPLYDYARSGEDVERAARPIRISRIDLVQFDGMEAVIEVVCGKGTYIRTLAEDIGLALGSAAHLGALVRTRVGDLRLENASSLAAIEGLDEVGRDALLLTFDLLLADVPRLVLPSPLEERFCQGREIGPLGTFPGRLRVYAGDGRFLGLGLADAHGMVRPKRVVAPAD